MATAEANRDGALRELSQARPEEFALVRSRLEKELSAAGDAEGAAELRRRRRPHLAAWACNQLVHQVPEALDELFGATEEVASAQQAALRGEGADVLREQTRARQALLDELAGEAVTALRGVTPKPETYRDNIVATLDKATIDPEAGQLLRSGLLTQALRAPAGFGGSVTVPAPAARPAPAKGRERQAARHELEAAQVELAKLAAAADEASAEQASAEMQAETTAAHVAEIEHALERARANARSAADEIAAARTRGSDARRAADDAAERVRRAEARLRELDEG